MIDIVTKYQQERTFSEEVDLVESMGDQTGIETIL